MRNSPIANREQLAAAIARAKADPAGRDKWYVIRVAKAMRLEQELPAEWQDQAASIVSFRAQPVADEVEQMTQSLAHDTATAVDAAAPGDDVIGLAASAATQALRSGQHDCFIRNFGAALDELVTQDRLYREDADAIVAAARKVASAEGARRYNKPIGTPLGQGDVSAKSVSTIHNLGNAIKGGTRIHIDRGDGPRAEKLLHTEDAGDDVILHTSDDSGKISQLRLPKKGTVDTIDDAPGASRDWKSKSQEMDERKAAARERALARQKKAADNEYDDEWERNYQEYDQKVGEDTRKLWRTAEEANRADDRNSESLSKRLSRRLKAMRASGENDVDDALTASVRKVRSPEGVKRYNLPVGTPLDGTHGDDVGHAVARIGESDDSGNRGRVTLRAGESIYLTGPKAGQVIPSGQTEPPKQESKPAPRPDRPKGWKAAYSPGSRMHRLEEDVAKKLASELERTGYLSNHEDDARLKQIDNLHGTSYYADAKAKFQKAKEAKTPASDEKNASQTTISEHNKLSDKDLHLAIHAAEAELFNANNAYQAASATNKARVMNNAQLKATAQQQKASSKLNALRVERERRGLKALGDDIDKNDPEFQAFVQSEYSTDYAGLRLGQRTGARREFAIRKLKNEKTSTDASKAISTSSTKSTPAVHDWRSFSDDGDPLVDSIKVGDIMHDSHMNLRREVVDITEEPDYRAFSVKNENGGTAQVRLKRPLKPMTDQELRSKHAETAARVQQMKAANKFNSRYHAAVKELNQYDSEIKKRGLDKSTSESKTDDTQPKFKDEDLIEDYKSAKKRLAAAKENGDSRRMRLAHDEIRDLTTVMKAQNVPIPSDDDLKQSSRETAQAKIDYVRRTQKTAPAANSSTSTDRDVVTEVTETNVNDSNTKTSETSPKSAAKAAEAVEAPTDASTASTWITGKQQKLGKINAAAKGQDPERFQPKTTLADGHSQKVGDRVRDESGRLGTITQTYQAFSAVKWDDTGKQQTVKNDKLNSGGSSSAAAKADTAPTAKATTPAKTTATPVKATSVDFSSMNVDQIESHIGDLKAKRNTATRAEKLLLDQRIQAATNALKNVKSTASASKRSRDSMIDNQIAHYQDLASKAKNASDKKKYQEEVDKLLKAKRGKV